MREELLAHVTAVFEEEKKLGDDASALKRTEQRFGDAAVLTAQLQESVRVVERFAYFVETLVGFPARESVVRRAARHAAAVGILGSVYLVLSILVQGNYSEYLTTARVPSLFASVIMAVLMFCGTLMVEAMRQALYGPHGRSWLRAGLVAAGAWLFIPAVTFLFCLAFSNDAGDVVRDMLPMIPIGLLGPVALVLVVRASLAEFSYEQEWASLPIG
jgi:hypothetical protein